MGKENREGLAIIAQLAEMLHVNLEKTHNAIATEKEDGTVNAYDGSIEAKVSIPLSCDERYVKIESPRNPGIAIRLIDTQKNPSVPKEAVYEISVYRSDRLGNRETLDGDIVIAWVGRDGIIITDGQRDRIMQRYQEKNKSSGT